ncbi:MAG: asparagine synthase (glutamine-hydrolyzing) [Rhodospirillales bacterium]|nr:asparagine synthase (glutamine-hydrolyzing) [Rhodospirillales bacterium]
MCGIAGLIELSGRSADAAVVAAMRDALAHRGPDAYGIWTDGPVGLGHRRLSIIDIADGAQPMHDPDTGAVLTYNGEIYNFREIRDTLEQRGHKFKTHSDTEVLLRSYVEWGEDMCAHFNGMFAFAIWDPRELKLVMARDRLGIKPLYWTRIGDTFAFASENKAFMAHPDFVAEANLDGVSSYLTFRQAVWDICFFKNVNKLLPGHMLVLKDGDVKTRAYWSLPVPNPGPDLGEDVYLENAQALLSKAVKRRMIADVPVGSYLSGGLDSSIIAAMMIEHTDRQVPTFSVGYIEEGYDEEGFARAVADHVGTRHEHLTLAQDDYLNTWRSLIKINDIPISIPHEVALYQLSAHMKKSVSVALSGEGADELFGGYGRVQRSPMDWKKIAAVRGALGGPLADKLSGLSMFKDTAVSQLGCASHMNHFFDAYNWMPFEEKWGLMTDDARHEIDNDARTIGVFANLFDSTAGADPYDRILHVFQKIHLGCLLDRLDMMSMASGLEARVPFVDHELIEYVIQIPVHHKMRWNSRLSHARALFHSSFKASEWLDTNKYLLRRIGDRLLPSEISRRKKLGFPTPLDSWFQGNMKDVAMDLLLDRKARERGIFDPQKVERFLAHRQDLPYDFYGKKVWMMMNIELWFREVIEQPAIRSGGHVPSITTSDDSQQVTVQ